MKYTQERNASAEISRLALQKMAVQLAALNPMSFAVWYEHVSGINPELSGKIEDLLREHSKLDDGQIEQLYMDYVSECGSKIQLTLREDLKLLLGKLNQLTAEADKQTSDYGNTLHDFGEKLKHDVSVSELDLLVKDISRDTDKMHASMQQMHEELEASHHEVERLNKEMEILKGAAMTDPLTGVLNRRGFESNAEALFTNPEASSPKGHCLLMLDVDHFKRINDTYGHLLGDKVLAAIANTLRIKVQGQDIVGRWGGEEFAILLPNTNLDGAFAVAEHIRQAIERGKIRRLDSNANIEGITISIGISFRKKEEHLQDLIERADKALYTSKKEGRNRITILD
ncbi:MAG: GGDEF domain-containing protein [Gammaproteobacteria bacterium]|nr:GGDEF domain-containing protein [Gammaproteobacteria bacterium]MBU4045337.1 GGDEF domain-containing protein [Gammaproteobacteria bacterium]MBU4151208.1 GGDEF domain-containing protein [Gammaproteobacteria bacterium]